MRSRTSRGVLEGSGGKDLYMGSCHADTGKFRGHIGIVLGPPEGFRGPPGGATGPGDLHGPIVGRDQPLGGLGHLPPGPKAPRVLGGGTPTLLGGKLPLSPPLAATLDGFGAAAPLGVGTLEGAQPPPSPLYIVEVFGAANT